MNDWINGVYTAIVFGIVSAFAFLIRKILTDGSKIDVLESNMEQVQDQLAEIRSDIKSLLSRK